MRSPTYIGFLLTLKRPSVTNVVAFSGFRGSKVVWYLLNRLSDTKPIDSPVNIRIIADIPWRPNSIFGRWPDSQKDRKIKAKVTIGGGILCFKKDIVCVCVC